METGKIRPFDDIEEQQVQPAEFGERFLAYVIDGLPFVIGCYISLHFMVKHMGLEYSYSTELKWKLVWICLYIVYETIFTSGGRATAGKIILGLRVKSLDGSNLCFKASFLRAVGYFMSAIPFNMGYLLAFFTSGKRALHDYVAGSMVIRLKPKSDFARGVVFAFSWGVFALLGISWYYENVVRLPPSEAKKVRLARTGLEKIAALEENYRQKHGSYTDNLGDLAVLSGDVTALERDLLKVLASEVAIAADSNHYLIEGHAKNNRKTKVQLFK